MFCLPPLVVSTCGGWRGGGVRSSNEQVWTCLQWQCRGGVGLQIWCRGGGSQVYCLGEGVGPICPQVWCLRCGGGTGALPSDLFHDSCDVPTPSPLWTDRRLWKHYLPGTSFAGGSYSRNDQKLKFLICDLLFMPSMTFPAPTPAPPRVEWCINGRSVTRKQKRLSLVWTWGRGPGSV